MNGEGSAVHIRAVHNFGRSVIFGQFKFGPVMNLTYMKYTFVINCSIIATCKMNIERLNIQKWASDKKHT